MEEQLEESEINQVIETQKDEQNRVQEKAFRKWVNATFETCGKSLTVENLYQDVRDGTVVLTLLQCMTAPNEYLEAKHTEAHTMVHHIDNITKALNFLQQRQIRLVNIHASDIANGNPKMVLGLIWTIILHFQIGETISLVVSKSPGAPLEGAKVPSSNEKMRKRQLLDLIKNVLNEKYDLSISDFGKSWGDGVAFCALVHHINPDLMDMVAFYRRTAAQNLNNAFSVAEEKLGIARLLDPEDVSVEKPDELSIMTYVAQFVKAYPDSFDAADMTSPSPEEEHDSDQANGEAETMEKVQRVEAQTSSSPKPYDDTSTKEQMSSSLLCFILAVLFVFIAFLVTFRPASQEEQEA